MFKKRESRAGVGQPSGFCGGSVGGQSRAEQVPATRLRVENTGLHLGRLSRGKFWRESSKA